MRHQDLPPVRIYGKDVTHIIIEEGIANLLLWIPSPRPPASRFPRQIPFMIFCLCALLSGLIGGFTVPAAGSA